VGKIVVVITLTAPNFRPMSGWIKMPLGREVGPGDIVLDGEPASPPPSKWGRGTAAPHFSAHVYCVNCGQAPKYIGNLVSTTQTTNYCLPRPRLWTMFRERAFSFSELAACNRLPHDIRASPSLNVFKRKLKTHFSIEAFRY